jgi:hypothetical protein
MINSFQKKQGSEPAGRQGGISGFERPGIDAILSMRSPESRSESSMKIASTLNPWALDPFSIQLSIPKNGIFPDQAIYFLYGST